MASTKLEHRWLGATPEWKVQVTHLNNQQIEVAHDIPRSRIYKGNASAEYVKGTGPSPGE